MASWLSRTTSSLVVRSNRCLLTREPPVKETRFSPPAVQKSITSLGQSISVKPVFKRMYCMKKETEIDEQQEMEEEGEAMPDNLYNTSTKIWLVCEEDFSPALEFAISLGDASNITVTSRYSFDHLKRVSEDFESQMFDLTKLGARIFLNYDPAEM